MVLSVDPVTGVGSADVPSANGAQDAWVLSGWIQALISIALHWPTRLVLFPTTPFSGLTGRIVLGNRISVPRSMHVASVWTVRAVPAQL